MNGSQAPSLPRTVTLASAGTGKTYTISTRIIGLLALGYPPDSILASTFTRKAAGEILDRVLLLLARGVRSADAASELSGNLAEMFAGAGRSDLVLDSDRCADLLMELVGSLHRTNVGTLDSLFVRIALVFHQELGLPPRWGIAQEGPLEARIRSDALERVLTEGDASELVEILRMAGRGSITRSVHRRLERQVDGLLRIYRDLDPQARDPWTPGFEGIDPEAPPDPDRVQADLQILADRVAAFEGPATRAGKPDTRWLTALSKLAIALREGDWTEALAKGLGKASLSDEPRYYGVPLADELLEILSDAGALAREVFAHDLIRQGRALGALAERYSRALDQQQEAEGLYRFEDITFRLREFSLGAHEEELYFRLDTGARHLLLDEFQDTSLTQWEVVRPLADQILSDGTRNRAAIVVGDPKQSIYGWRGGRPELMHDLRRDDRLSEERMGSSWRSSQVILDAVQETFRSLPSNQVLQEIEHGAEVAQRWILGLQELRAERDLPGYVRMLAGPVPETKRTLKPTLLGRAVDLVEQVRMECPWASIGVLTRSNSVVTWLMASLRSRDIPASGEGGTSLTDAAPVNGILALLTLADHPGDRLASYHVARSPLGALMDHRDFKNEPGAARLAHRVREALLSDGYGVFIEGLVNRLAPGCSSRERARLWQLVELAWLWDRRASLRPTDFVRLVEKLGVEDPLSSPVRVMTVHKAKGLEFDIVVLPELTASMTPSIDDSALPVRGAHGRIERVYPSGNALIRSLLPELGEPFRQAVHSSLQDEISNLYVAMTRARYALHLLVPGDGPKGPGKAKSYANVLRAALCPDRDAIEEITVWERGDPAWFQDPRIPENGSWSTSPLVPATETDPVILKPSERRTRNLPRRTPSGLEGGDVVDLDLLLRLGTEGSLALGSLVHGWMESLRWIEDGLPPDEELASMAGRITPGVTRAQVAQALGDLRSWLASPEIAGQLTRSLYAADRVTVETELPFAVRTPDGILRGDIDRLVVEWEGAEPVRAHVLDYKTDVVEDGERRIMERSEFYAPQLGAYRSAVSALFGLDAAAVRATLLFLKPGRAVDVEDRP
jgi:ATP-dependent exoDNAse (exonuclease V) beta subunit